MRSSLPLSWEILIILGTMHSWCSWLFGVLYCLSHGKESKTLCHSCGVCKTWRRSRQSVNKRILYTSLIMFLDNASSKSKKKIHALIFLLVLSLYVSSLVSLYFCIYSIDGVNLCHLMNQEQLETTCGDIFGLWFMLSLLITLTSTMVEQILGLSELKITSTMKNTSKVLL